jgi:hypothetical protein
MCNKGARHGTDLPQRLADARDVADAEGDRVHVEARVVEGQLLRVRHDPVHPRPAGGSARVELRRALPALVEHLLIDVAHDDARLLVIVHAGRRWMCTQLVRDAEGDVARATRNVQHLQVGAALGAHAQHAHEDVLPRSMDAGRHEIVHDIVVGGNAVEHVANEPLLVGLVDRAEAKVCRRAVGRAKVARS